MPDRFEDQLGDGRAAFAATIAERQMRRASARDRLGMWRARLAHALGIHTFAQLMVWDRAINRLVETNVETCLFCPRIR